MRFSTRQRRSTAGAKRSKRRLRNLSFELLEARDMLVGSLAFAEAESPAVAAIQAAMYVEPGENPFGSSAEFSSGGEFEAFQINNRWTTTATNTGTLGQGDPTTLTWGIADDGTPIPAFNGGAELAANSTLIAFLDGIRGAGPGGSDLTQRPWFQVFNDSFARLSALAGLTYVFEPNDDGLAFSNSNTGPGLLGTRADIRIGGHFIDGEVGSNTLAYNFFPNTGDMVIDTGNPFFFSGLNNNSVGFRNLVMHENGHGIGLNHVESSDSRFLMEPFISTQFDGPQLDDILAMQRNYGDVLERNAGNDTFATATDLGVINVGQTVFRGTNGDSTVVAASDVSFVSIDDESDKDFFKFTVGADVAVTLNLTPRGTTYLQGSQGGTQTTFNSKSQSDLSLQLLGTNGTTLLAEAKANGLGGSEAISDFVLTNPGTYFVRVSGSTTDKIQLYGLDVFVAANTSLPTVSVAVAPTAVLEDGPGVLDYTFTRTGSLAAPLTVNFNVGGTATLTNDYVPASASAFSFTETSGTVTFAAGSSTATINLDPKVDATAEENETAIVTLTAGTGYNVVTPDVATGTIQNDDTNVSVAVSPGTAAEDGATILVYTFTRSGDTTFALPVNFNVSGAAVFNTDYAQSGAATFSATAGTVVIPAGAISAAVTLDPTADSGVELDESVVLTVTAASIPVGPIAEQEPNNSLATAQDVDGGNWSTSFDASINDSTSNTSTTIPHITISGSGNNTFDYYSFTVANAGDRGIFDIDGANEGYDAQIFIYDSLGNRLDENDDSNVSSPAEGSPNNENRDSFLDFSFPVPGRYVLVVGRFEAFGSQGGATGNTPRTGDLYTLHISVANHTAPLYTVGSPSTATGTIINDDVSATVSVTVSPAAVTEDGAANLVYTFTRTGPTTNTLTVNFTVSGTADFDDDYSQSGATTFNANTGSVTFAPGSSTAAVTLDPKVDAVVELDESTSLTIVSGAGYTVGAPATAAADITNDDTEVSVVVSPSAVLEDGSQNLAYSFTRTGVTSNSLTVQFGVSGSATFDTDYTTSGATTFNSTAGTVSFAPGETTALVTIDPKADTLTEAAEQAILSVQSFVGSGYNVGSPNVATGVINDDEPPGVDLRVTISDSPDPVAAGSGTGNLVYAVRVENVGLQNASGVSLALSNLFPLGVSFVSALGPGNNSLDGLGTDVWDIGSLAIGAAATLEITYTVGASTLHGTTVSVNAAGLNANEILVNTDDDSAAAATAVFATDFGDAPEPKFETRLVNNGARHLATGARLGNTRDAETNGQPSATATGDDGTDVSDEDGLVSQSPIFAGAPGSITVNVQGVTGLNFINAWIDFNQNGDWGDPDEKVATDVPVTASGNQVLNFVAPLTVVPGITLSRFRLSTAAGLTLVGAAPDGEVEDHLLAQVDAGDITTEVVVDNPQKPLEKRLVITGDAGFNQLALDLGPGGVKNSVRVVGANGSKVDGSTLPVEFTGITKGITVRLLGGNDVVTVNGSRVAGPITLDGGLDNDTYIVAASKTKFVLVDGGGLDLLDFSRQTKGAKVDLAKAPGKSQGLGNSNTATLEGQFENVLGSPFKDTFKGNAADNVLLGEDGNDTLDGREGNDLLRGGRGNDKLTGGAGNDILVGEEGKDTLKAVAGFDVLIGGLGKDTLIGAKSGNTVLIGGTTAHDLNNLALLAILREWSSETAPGTPALLADRVDNLTGGGGQNGSVVLTVPATVVDDALRETLKSSLGNNWIFHRASEKHSGLKPTDEQTP